MQAGSDVFAAHPLLVTAPGLAVVLTALPLSLIGDGISGELARKT
jgi:ABC-type dipeptide/oligopeptide/nickel transport system permease subunit